MGGGSSFHTQGGGKEYLNLLKHCAWLACPFTLWNNVQSDLLWLRHPSYDIWAVHLPHCHRNHAPFSCTRWRCWNGIGFTICPKTLSLQHLIFGQLLLGAVTYRAHHLALFKSQLGEPFLGILIFFFSSFLFFPFSLVFGKTGT